MGTSEIGFFIFPHESEHLGLVNKSSNFPPHAVHVCPYPVGMVMVVIPVVLIIACSIFFFSSVPFFTTFAAANYGFTIRCPILSAASTLGTAKALSRPLFRFHGLPVPISPGF
jgi:hypothetical protein